MKERLTQMDIEHKKAINAQLQSCEELQTVMEEHTDLKSQVVCYQRELKDFHSSIEKLN